MMIYTGEAHRMRETSTAQLVKSRSKIDKLPFKILTIESELLQQFKYKLDALTAWQELYARD